MLSKQMAAFTDAMSVKDWSDEARKEFNDNQASIRFLDQQMEIATKKRQLDKMMKQGDSSGSDSDGGGSSNEE